MINEGIARPGKDLFILPTITNRNRLLLTETSMKAIDRAIINNSWLINADCKRDLTVTSLQHRVSW